MKNRKKYKLNLKNVFITIGIVAFIMAVSILVEVNTGLFSQASDVCKKMNIYDLAGNVEEWTLEYTNNSANSCARRSGNYQTSGSNEPASSRNLNPATTSVGTVGFRTALFK